MRILSTKFYRLRGNDTIHPYPLIAGEAKKILIVRSNIFEELCKLYKAFYRELKGRAVRIKNKRSKQYFPRPKVWTPEKTYSAYEPSKAIVVNECEYRRWCRVSEWFAEFGPDDEKLERNKFDSIKMDT